MKTAAPYDRNAPKRSKKGKSGREKDVIIAEHKEIILQLKKRIQTLQASIKRERERKNRRYTKEELLERESAIREKKNKRILNLNLKVERRDNRVEVKENKIQDLNQLLKQKEKELQKLTLEIEKRAQQVQDISYRKRKVRYQWRDKPVPAEIKRLQKIYDNGIRTAKYDIYVNSIKIVNFARENQITSDLLAIMLQVHAQGSCKVTDLKSGTRAILNTGVRQEMLTYQQIKQMKHYFLTHKGAETVKKFYNYVSYKKL